jgi:transposase InsO family protein
MPWKGVTVSEARQQFLKDYWLGYYTISDLADRHMVSRKTAHKWIERVKRYGEEGFHELSRRPLHSPGQTDAEIVRELLELRKMRPTRGPANLLDQLQRRHPEWELPSVSTVARILAREGLVRPRRRHRRAHPGCPKTVAAGPNDIWAADYKGQFRLKNGQYCFPLTVSDLASRYVLGVDAHPTISYELTQKHFQSLFEAYGLPNRIRTDNGVPFASNALARLSQLSAWFIKLGIYPELIEPGRPSQNGIHERMHRTLKQEATIPPAANLSGQQRKLDEFRRDFNEERGHQALGMKRPAEVYEPSLRPMPRPVEAYEYPGHYLVRRVSRCGTIRVLKQQVFVSSTLKEESVGLEEVDDGVYDLYYCFYQIGRYHLQGNRIEDIVSRVPVVRRRIELARQVLPMS